MWRSNFAARNDTASGRDVCIRLVQTREEATQRAVLMRSATSDEQGLHPRLRRAEGVDADTFVSTHHGARQQCYAHAGGDAADHAVERAELEPDGRGPAEFGEGLIKKLASG